MRRISEEGWKNDKSGGGGGSRRNGSDAIFVYHASQAELKDEPGTPLRATVFH